MKCTTAVVCAAGLFGGLVLAWSPAAFSQNTGNGKLLPAEILPALPLNPGPIVHSADTLPLTVPDFNSRPGAPAKIYLDFDGDYTANWGGYTPLTTPAYDIDGDPTTFSQQELDNIHEICMRVAEAYSPFNVTVTTENPGTLFDRQAMRIVIGGDGTNESGGYWVGAKAGGVGYISGFSNALYPNTVYVFPKNLGNGDPKVTSDAAAHEAGHSFGLQHQSLWGPDGKTEYNPGDPNRAPFMGTAYHATRGLWYVGPTITPAATQDDVAVISGPDNGFGYYWGNDPGGTPATAAALPPVTMDAPFSIDGLITTTDDKDFYSFTTTQVTLASFDVTGAPFGAMLDPDLALYDAVSGDLLETVNWGGLSESFSMLLGIGQFDIAVISAGNMGDIGQYTLSGVFAIPEPAFLSAMILLPLLARRKRQP